VTDTVGGSETDPDFDAQFAQLLREVEQGRPAPVKEPSARARMLQNKWRDQPPPTTPWRGDVPTLGDATARFGKTKRNRARARQSVLRNAVIAIIIGVLAFGILETIRR
jgi:hypothetical protein